MLRNLVSIFFQNQLLILAYSCDQLQIFVILHQKFPWDTGVTVDTSNPPCRFSYKDGVKPMIKVLYGRSAGRAIRQTTIMPVVVLSSGFSFSVF